MLTEWADIPLKKVYERIQKLKEVEDKDWLLFIDCREPSEIQKLKERLNATTVLIRRESVEYNEVSNHADADVFNYEYDYVIENNGSLEELYEKAKGFLKLIEN